MARPQLVAALIGALLLPLSTSWSKKASAVEGLAVAAENRCSPYDRGDYSYPQSVEPKIIARLGDRIYSPYSGNYFAHRGQTDIEHIVALSEAHDSGLCAAAATTRRRFARDLDNLTLASPAVNRGQKGARDVGEWLPALNQCWYVAQVVKVKRKYALSVDRREAAAIQRVLDGCPDTKMRFTDPRASTVRAPRKKAAADDPVLRRYDDNRNGRITCAEARAHGIAPVPRSHPAYAFMRDGDGDGVVCE